MSAAFLNRRKWLLGMGAVPVCAWAGAGAPPKKDRVDIAMDRGAGFIQKMQEANGAFNDPKARESARNGYAMTALGLLALASIGHQPSDPGKIGTSMGRALDFILRDDPQRINLRGIFKGLDYFGSDGSRMYGHGITTLCLTEMMGMTTSKRQELKIRSVAQKAIALIMLSQAVQKSNPKYRGGWRYTPLSQDSDLSISVWQLMALRSAKNAGLAMKMTLGDNLLTGKAAIEEAVRYLKRSYFSPRDGRGMPVNMRSGCGYLPGQPPEFATAAAGLLSLQVCGEYESPEVKGSAAWLSRQEVSTRLQWFYYGMYYYAQGMQKREPVVADKAKQVTEDVLLKLQRADGSWDGHDGMERSAGRIYCTALAMLSLSVKYHYLPIYQH